MTANLRTPCLIAALIASVGAFQPGAAVAGKEQVAQTPLPPATRPIVILSFIAGIDSDMEVMAAQRYGDLNLGRPRKKAPVVSTALSDMIVNTSIWVPYYHEQLEKEFGKGSVILDPVYINPGAGGTLVLKGDADTGLAQEHLLFLAYENPYGGAPYSIGHWLTPIILRIPSQTMPNTTLKWADFVTLVNGDARDVSMGKVDTPIFDQVMGPASGRPGDVPIRLFDKTVAQEVGAIKALPSDGLAQFSLYRTTLEIEPARDPDFALTKRFLAAETGYRAMQSAALVHYLQDSDYAQNVKTIAQKRDGAIRKQHAANRLAIFGALAGGLNMASAATSAAGSAAAASANAALVSDAAIVSMAADQANAAHMEAAALANMNAQHIAMGEVDIGNGQSLTASSVDDLRGKMHDIAYPPKVLASRPAGGAKGVGSGTKTLRRKSAKRLAATQ